MALKAISSFDQQQPGKKPSSGKLIFKKVFRKYFQWNLMFYRFYNLFRVINFLVLRWSWRRAWCWAYCLRRKQTCRWCWARSADASNPLYANFLFWVSVGPVWRWPCVLPWIGFLRWFLGIWPFWGEETSNLTFLSTVTVESRLDVPSWCN